ncbi:MAG: hypothetical protein WCG44_00305 [bacterium]
MRLIQKPHPNLLTYNLHGYYLAKKFFKGPLEREFLVTLYDKQSKLSYFGYIYVTRKNALLVVDSFAEVGYLNEFESTDKLSVIENVPQDTLKRSMESEGKYQITLSIKTANPISYIELNDRFLLILNIQPEHKNGSHVEGSIATVYLTGKNYREKVTNSLKIIKLAIEGRLVKVPTPIHGLSPLMMKVNFSLMYFVVIVFPLGFYYLLKRLNLI